MNDRTILDIGFLPDPDIVHIPPQDAVVPDAGLVADFDIANHRGVLGQEYVFADHRHFAFVGEDQGHDLF